MRRRKLAARLVWMILIWSASVIALLLAASVIRGLMRAIGMAI